MMTLTFDDSVYVRFVRTKGTISSRSFDEEVSKLVNVGSQDYSICIRFVYCLDIDPSSVTERV